MATTIGLPSLTISFQKAAQAVANRSKKGYVGVFVRDTQAQGVHQLTSAALIPSNLGADNQAYIRRVGPRHRFRSPAGGSGAGAGRAGANGNRNRRAAV